MELSIREAKARFAEAATAATRGERVIITKFGHSFVELVPIKQACGMDEIRAADIRRSLGIDGLSVRIPAEFDDAGLSRDVLGLTE